MKNAENSTMEKFLRSKNMCLSDFARKAGCTRQTIWRVKLGYGVTTDLAYKIFTLTRGEVQPICSDRGKQKKEKQ